MLGRKKKNKGGKAGDAAEKLGTALGKAAAKVDKVNARRAKAVTELNAIIAKAQKALSELEMPTLSGAAKTKAKTRKKR